MTKKQTQAPERTELRIGMLGYGFMGKCHSHAFKSIPYIYPEANLLPRLQLLCGRDEKKTSREAARYGFEEYCTDWQEMVGDGQIDIFDNCGPDPVHAEPCIAALQNAKHVICEKPLAVSVEDARRMRDAARESSGKAMCVFNYRFFPAVRFAKDLVGSGKLGNIYHMQVSYMQMAGHDPSIPPDEVWYSAWPHSGVLQGIGSHAIDQCRYLVGEIKSVMGRVKTFNKSRAVLSAGCEGVLADEATGAVLEFESGATGVMVASGVAAGRKNFLGWEINGSKGSLRWNLEHANSLFACMKGFVPSSLFGFTEIFVTDKDHPYASSWWPPGHNLGWEHAHTIEKFHFLNAIAKDTPMSPDIATFEDGYRAAVIIHALRRSSDTGNQVSIELG